MIARTISQLPLAENIQDDDLIEVSKFENNKYISTKCKLGALNDDFEKKISTDVATKFSLYDDVAKLSGEISVRGLSVAVDDLYNSGQVQLKGKKTFKTIPQIDVPLTEYRGAEDYDIPNIMKTKDLIEERTCFVGDNYMVDGNPGNDANPPEARDSDIFMHWHFDDGGTDSTKWIDPQTGRPGAEFGQKCTHTGYLVAYGWLADKGGVLPQDAWVAIYGNMQLQSATDSSKIEADKWVLLQVQPWIRGSNATQLQYVGFNIPVKEGLRLKIKTGFNVNGKVGGFQDHRSLTYALNQPNSFFGYIVRAED